MRKTTVLAAVLASLVGFRASADEAPNVVDGKPFISNPQTGEIGKPPGKAMFGMSQNLNQFQLRTDENGNAIVSGLGLTTPMNPGIAATTIPAGALYKASVPLNIGGYDSFQAIVQFAVADTDSVCLEVFAIAKETSNAFDGLDAVFNSDTTSVGPKGWLVSNNRPMLELAALKNRRVYSTKPWGGSRAIGAMSQTISTSVSFDICDDRGRAPHSTWLNIWVLNRRLGAAATNVTVDIIAKKGT